MILIVNNQSHSLVNGIAINYVVINIFIIKVYHN